jgi:hypothetical protein
MPRFQKQPPRHPSCRFCNEAVELENSQTDQDGKAVHEECYVSALKRENPKTPSTRS